MKNIKNSEDDVVQILIAEDSSTQAEQLKYLLEKYNYKVIVAKDGKEALNLLNEFKPAIIITDIVMPEMNGYELCKEIKSNESTIDIPVILLTSLSRSEDILEGISCGADNFITKPYHDDYLISHIEQIIANRKFNKSERVRVGVEIIFGGKRRFISATQQQMLTLLISTYEAAVQRNNELIQAQEELKAINENLEELVLERTNELLAEIDIRKNAEKRIIKLNRIYAVLSNINKAIVRVRDIDQLFQDTCNIAIDEGKFQSAWIGIVNNETNKIETFAAAGLANELIEVSPYQNPVTGVISSGKHFISNSINTDKSIPEIWKRNSLSLGFRSFAAFPLIVFGKVTGGFCIYSNEVDFFDEIEISLLDEMATDVSFALEYIQNEIERKKADLLIQENTEQLKVQNIELHELIKELSQTNTELVIAKEKAEESDRLKTAFLHNISHEIRTPMNAIIGFSEFLNDLEFLPEKRKHFTDIIVQNCYQLLSIISDIISIATIEAGQAKITENEVDLNSTLRLLHEQFLLKDQKKNVILILKNTLLNGEVNITSDETKLVQILTNLIGNALKFTQQGYVNFGYKLKSNELEFFVEDTGIGIPPEMHQVIFNRFRQVDDTAQQFGGSGLGLSISKAYVELMGGKMWLKSELGKGSTFYFTIPYKKVQRTTLLGKQSINAIKFENKTTITLLIAEDEESNFMLLEEFLTGLNIEIVWAKNGLEAIEICKTQGIDLILMDLKMPVMDGYEATMRIKNFKPNMPVIAQTAYTTDLDRNKALACGCSDFITKPLKRELLISKIKKHLK
ncbi:MAG: response regulator [Bacteroidales bacterium]|nr:response regulator [Bacteroidales bacterium]